MARLAQPRWETSPQLALALAVFFAAMVVVAVVALVTQDGEWDNWVFLLAMAFNLVVWTITFVRRSEAPRRLPE